MVDLTGDQKVKAICPRCKGNGYIVVQGESYDCAQCDNQMFVWLPANQCRRNIEGGIEPKWMKSGEAI